MLNTTPSVPLVHPDPDELALAEEDNVANIMSTGCGCSLADDGRYCSTQFTAEYILAVRGESRELTHAELDMVFMGELRAVLNTTGNTFHGIR